MKQILAQKIAGLLDNYPATGQFTISEKIPPGVMTNFHTFTNNRYCSGAFLVEVDGRDPLWIVIVDAKDSGRYYVMLYPKARTSSIAEIHVQKELSLHWTYKPRKRDGKNPQRLSYFAEVFLSTDVIISIPSRADQVDDFLSELISLAECRLKADKLDENKPIARDGFPEGKLKERLHLTRERNPKLVKIAKEEAERREGCLRCACTSEFASTYPSL